MALKNTAENYGSVAKWLHWGMALLFLGSYCTVYYRRWFTEKDTPENWIALQLHFSVGLTIAALVVLRIFWKIMNRAPAQEPGPRLGQLAAHWGHYLLYVVMIGMPLTGYMGTGVNTEYFLSFDITRFPDTQAFATLVSDGLGMSFKEFERPIDFIHKDIGGALLVWMLIIGHMLAALYHHFVRKDRTLRKMTFDRPAAH